MQMGLSSNLRPSPMTSMGKPKAPSSSPTCLSTGVSSSEETSHHRRHHGEGSSSSNPAASRRRCHRRWRPAWLSTWPERVKENHASVGEESTSSLGVRLLPAWSVEGKLNDSSSTPLTRLWKSPPLSFSQLLIFPLFCVFLSKPSCLLLHVPSGGYPHPL